MGFPRVAGEEHLALAPQQIPVHRIDVEPPAEVGFKQRPFARLALARNPAEHVARLQQDDMRQRQLAAMFARKTLNDPLPLLPLGIVRVWRDVHGLQPVGIRVVHQRSPRRNSLAR